MPFQPKRIPAALFAALIAAVLLYPIHSWDARLDPWSIGDRIAVLFFALLGGWVLGVAVGLPIQPDENPGVQPPLKVPAPAVIGLGGAAILALPALFVLPPVHAHGVEGRLAALCLDGGGDWTCNSYLDRFPAGPHAAAIDDRIFERSSTTLTGIRGYATTLPHGRHIGDLPGANRQVLSRILAKRGPDALPGITKVLEALRDAGRASIPLRLTASVDLLGKDGHLTTAAIEKEFPGKTFDPFMVGLSDPALANLEERNVADDLAEVFRFGDEAIEVVPGGDTAGAPVTIEISEVTYPTDDIYVTTSLAGSSWGEPDASSSSATYGVGIDWVFTLNVAGEKAFTVKTTTTPSESTISTGYYSTGQIELQQSARRAFVGKMKIALGG
jgi:hypothetical protein